MSRLFDYHPPDKCCSQKQIPFHVNQIMITFPLQKKMYPHFVIIWNSGEWNKNDLIKKKTSWNYVRTKFNYCEINHKIVNKYQMLWTWMYQKCYLFAGIQTEAINYEPKQFLNFKFHQRIWWQFKWCKMGLLLKLMQIANISAAMIGWSKSGRHVWLDEYFVGILLLC